MERSTEQSKNKLEVSWLNHDLAQSSTWSQYKNTQRDYAYFNKQFVVWDLIDGQPRLIEVLKVAEIGVSWDEGLTFILKSTPYESHYTITAKPREHVDGIFFWIPGFSDVRFAPFQYMEPGSARRLTIPLMFRTAHRPGTAGQRHISSMQDFKKAWPGVFRD